MRWLQVGARESHHVGPNEILGCAATRIIDVARGINRVVYDITSKPPGSLE